MYYKYLFTILMLLMNANFCFGQEKTYTVEIVNGVRHVHNKTPLWGNEPKVSLEFVQKIGGLDIEDENYIFYWPRDIARDTKGNLYVLDLEKCRVQKFDPEGRYLATIGGKGQGPGEFEFPVSLHIDAQGFIYVAQPTHGTFVSILASDGKEIKRIKLPNMFDYVHITHAGNIIMPAPPVKRDKWDTIAQSPLIYIFDSEGNLINSFGKLHDYGNPELTYWGNSIDITIDSDDNILVMFAEQNRIEKYTPEGEIIFRADRLLNYKLDSKDAKIDIKIEQIPRSLTFKDLTNVSSAIGTDHKGRIWEKPIKSRRKIMMRHGITLNLNCMTKAEYFLQKCPFHRKEVPIFLVIVFTLLLRITCASTNTK